MNSKLVRNLKNTDPWSFGPVQSMYSLRCYITALAGCLKGMIQLNFAWHLQLHKIVTFWAFHNKMGFFFNTLQTCNVINHTHGLEQVGSWQGTPRFEFFLIQRTCQSGVIFSMYWPCTHCTYLKSTGTDVY